ncbi:MAG: error-prone DNA polymerase [Hyphomicrobiaceae bacterium]|nr:error-prone DNA polymerase [Hyphomicrobiaceae bacterium]
MTTLAIKKAASAEGQASAAAAYAALQVTTNFSFLRGASHPDELVATAKALGLAAIAITDRNTLAGVVRAHVAGRDLGFRVIAGARLDLEDGPSLLCLPTDRAAYGRLSRLLSQGQLRAGKGQCRLHIADVAAHAEGQVLIVLPPEDWDWRAEPPVLPATGRGAAGRSPVQCPGTAEQGPPRSLSEGLARLLTVIDVEHLHLAAVPAFAGEDRARLARLARLAEAAGMGLVATGDVLYHSAERRPLQDVLTAIREGVPVARAGFRLAANAERHLRSPGDMAWLFRDHPDALTRTLAIAQACRFSLDELVYEYPDEPVPPGRTAQSHLEALAMEGARWRYPDGVPPAVGEAIRRELSIIATLGYAPYFLTVHDIVAFARARGILAQGRGSAANSAVCYCLGITAVNPAEADLLFERFVSPERREPPDIDVDFEHERREEVIQYIYARYGRDRAGLAATVISYRARSAVRDVGKAMGLSEDAVTALSGMVWGTRSGGALPEAHIREAGFDPGDPLLARVIELARELMGFPRHLSQHVGGFVLTRGPLCEVVPIGNAAMEGRTVIEWDKDDIAALGLLKIDVLALGMLSCIRKAFDLITRHHGQAFSLGKVPRGDTATFDMLCRADSIGVFQVESRAQMNMLPRLKPRTFYDLVIEVAIVRPGPIQGDMVHPYLRRRSGQEPEVYPAPDPAHGPPDELRQILGKTKGVPLFQEQAMRIAMVAARFSDAEVNELRKAMATFRRRGTIGLLEEKMVARMVERGYDPAFAARCFNQIKGFGEYGFPESHAASFAHLVYVSAWLKCHYPAAFACALINAQPMGFYAPAQIVRDARGHGVEVREADVSFSDWDCTLEAAGDGPALRLGLRLVDGLGEADGRRIAAARGNGFADLDDLLRRSRMGRGALERLAAADTLRSLGLDRRQGLWQVSALPPGDSLPLFSWGETREDGPEAAVALPEMTLGEHVVADYQTLRLSLKAHPMALLRDRLAGEGIVTAERLGRLADGARVRIAGIVLVRQRPGSAKGVVFMTIEDETGVANAVVWPKVLERYRKVVMTARLMLIEGRVQRHEDIIHVVCERLIDRSGDLMVLSEAASDMPVPIANADEVLNPEPGSARGSAQADEGQRPRHPRWAGHPRDHRVIPKSRDFH